MYVYSGEKRVMLSWHMYVAKVAIAGTTDPAVKLIFMDFTCALLCCYQQCFIGGNISRARLVTCLV